MAKSAKTEIEQIKRLEKNSRKKPHPEKLRIAKIWWPRFIWSDGQDRPGENSRKGFNEEKWCGVNTTVLRGDSSFARRSTSGFQNRLVWPPKPLIWTFLSHLIRAPRLPRPIKSSGFYTSFTRRACDKLPIKMNQIPWKKAMNSTQSWKNSGGRSPQSTAQSKEWRDKGDPSR